MAKIKTISERDIYGTGYKQEITLDNGKSYKIQTSTERDVYGTGNKKEIVSSDEFDYLGAIIGSILGVLIVPTIFIGGAFLIFKLMGY